MAEAARGLGLILNGNAAGDPDLRSAVGDLRAAGTPVHVRVTWEDGDAARQADELIALGVRTLVACGGDGTLGAVAAALAARDADAAALPALAAIPLGTANDFATAAGIPSAPAEALALCARPPQPIDLLRIDADGARRWCLNLATGGFGAQATQAAGSGLKSALGGTAYLLRGLMSLGNLQHERARFTADGFAWTGDFIAVGIGNGRLAGGGQPLCPDACIDDGLLELTLVPPLEGELGATLGKLLAEGREAALEQAALRRRLAAVRIEADTPLTLNLDGEPCEARCFEIACVPRRLRMHLPDGCPLLASS
ncbi:MAG: lipid kinase YegS [Xanthomonadales bacterium]|nr:lipid kinase YegS [Xanthomonadales bacterium]